MRTNWETLCNDSDKNITTVMKQYLNGDLDHHETLYKIHEMQYTGEFPDLDFTKEVEYNVVEFLTDNGGYSENQVWDIRDKVESEMYNKYLKESE